MKYGSIGRAVAALFISGLLMAVSPSRAALDPGVAAPGFTAPAALAGKTFTFVLDKALRKGPVVLYFFPEAFTDGCTIEAKTFAEALPKFKALGATVVGMSRDSMTVLKKFSVEACHSKFAVVSDPSLETIRKYDAALWQGGDDRAGRITYIISPDHQVIYSYASDSPDQHVEYALDALSKWRVRNPMAPAKAAKPPH